MTYNAFLPRHMLRLRVLTSQSNRREYRPLARASRAWADSLQVLGSTSKFPLENLELLHKAHPSFAESTLSNVETISKKLILVK
jgi:hypothetical protein